MVREGNVEDVEGSVTVTVRCYSADSPHIPEGNVRRMDYCKLSINLRQTSPLPYPLWG